MPFVPFKKGGGKAAPTSGKTPAGKKANPFAKQSGPNQPKKTKRSPFS